MMEVERERERRYGAHRLLVLPPLFSLDTLHDDDVEREREKSSKGRKSVQEVLKRGNHTQVTQTHHED